MKTVSWFSAGGSSAVATKLMIDRIDQIFYIHIDDQHPDTMRFVKDCEQWFGKPVEILQSHYKNVETACRMSGGRGYINGIGGAACTKFLKKRVRQDWEARQTGLIRYVWGMDYKEKKRANDLLDAFPNQEHLFPLIDAGLDKEMIHIILSASDIKRPVMYDLGYTNNNCIGCIKGGMGYWNHIRVDFPEVFESRAKLERIIGASCINGTYLDELDPNRGRHEKPILEDCGVLCELLSL